MRKMLLTFIISYIIYIPVSSEELKRYDAGIAYFYTKVFYKENAVMPIRSEFIISLKTTYNHEYVYEKPDNIEGLMIKMINLLPSWYINALLLVPKGAQCSVNVNGKNYTRYIAAWIEKYWGVFNPDSMISYELEMLGYNADSYVFNKVFIMNAFCDYILSSNYEEFRSKMLENINLTKSTADP